ncbi:unnamed protein product [Urochloa humidicola]
MEGQQPIGPHPHGGAAAAGHGQDDADEDLLFMMALTRLLAEDFSRACAPNGACDACHSATRPSAATAAASTTGATTACNGPEVAGGRGGPEQEQ